jgi:hypothetical protein
MPYTKEECAKYRCVREGLWEDCEIGDRYPEMGDAPSSEDGFTIDKMCSFQKRAVRVVRVKVAVAHRERGNSYNTTRYVFVCRGCGYMFKVRSPTRSLLQPSACISLQLP